MLCSQPIRLNYITILIILTFPPKSTNADPGSPGLMPHIKQWVALAVAGIGHGAELVNGERLAVQAGTLLAEEDRRAQLDTHQQNHQYQHG